MLRVPSLYLLLLCVGLNAPFLSEKGVVYGENLIAKDKQSINAALDTLPRIQPTSTIEHNRRVDLVLFSPSNNYLASESVGEDIKITDPVDGTLLRALILPGCSVRSMGFSQDGRVLAIGTNTGQVELWDMRTHQPRKKIPVTRWNIDAVAISPDNSTLASCRGDGTVQLWDIDGAIGKYTLGNKGTRMSSLAFSDDGSLLATLGLSPSARCCVWEMKTGNLVRTTETHRDGQVTFLPGSKTAVIVTPFTLTFWNPIENSTSKIVSLPDSIDPDKREITSLSEPRFAPSNAISADCRMAASGLIDGSIAVWMVESRTANYILVGDSIPDHMGGGIQSIAFSPDNKFIASGNTNGKVQVWNIEDMD